MANFLIKNSLNPHKVIKCGVTLTQYVDYNRHDGEPIWLLSVGTDALDKNGNKIKNVFANLITLDSVDKEIEKLAAQISKQIDWEPYEEDISPPYVDSVYPTEYIAKINDPVEFVIKDDIPSTGIDLTTLKVTANGFDITNDLEITGNPYEYHIKWRPPLIIYDTYE